MKIIIISIILILFLAVGLPFLLFNISNSSKKCVYGNIKNNKCVCDTGYTGKYCNKKININRNDAADINSKFYYKYKKTDQPYEDCQLYTKSTTEKCMTVPTYSDAINNGYIWECPALDDYSKTWPEFQNGGEKPNDPYGYALCPGAFDNNKCCLPVKGCLPKNSFNWIISTCKGRSCGDWGQYDKNRDNEMVKKTAIARDIGSKVIVNYVGAFQYNKDKEIWVKQPYSSFNTYGKYPAYDLSKSQKNGWMPGPQPGGAVFWKYGWYPGGLSEEQGVSPPAMMFVLSTEECWNMAWFIMNQATLDRGPDKHYPSDKCPNGINQNTWACANSGEWDLLESSWSVTGFDEDGSYDNLYSTLTNAGNAGRALWPSYGTNPKARSPIGNFSSPCYIKGSNNSPQIFVAVIDSIGCYVYYLPVDKANDIWPGINRKYISDELPGTPKIKPNSSPCKDLSKFCCVFSPHSQYNTAKEILDNKGFAPGDRGFCGNYTFNNLVDTKQQWGSTAAIINGKKQPWNIEMECMN